MARDEGSTSTIGLAIAAVVFAGAFMTAEIMVGHPTSVDGKREQFDAEAATALDVLVGTAGQTTGGGAWSADPDHLARFGLALNGTPNFLDYVKIHELRNGTMTASANGYPDYPEVLKALGITTGDVHIRSYPVLPSMDDPRWTRDPNGRLAYIGQYQGAIVPVTVSIAYAKTTGAMNVSVNITNSGNVPAIFVLDIIAKHGGNLVHSSGQEMNTLLLQPNQTMVVWGNFTAISSWHADVQQVEVDLTDPFGNPAVDVSGNPVTPYVINQIPPAGGASSYEVYVSAANKYYVQGQSVTFAAYALDGKGGRPNGATGRFVLVGPDGREWENYTVAFNTTSDYMAVCPNCTQLGVYTAYVWDTGMTAHKQDQVTVAATQLFTQKDVQSANATSEIAALSSLVQNFNTQRYNASSYTQGDVFGDDFNGAADLIPLLSRYTTIVVGTEVSQNSLNTPGFRNAIATWVQAGGNLVVLGTNTQQSSWLSNIYAAAQANANGGISAPDVTHPILVTPNHLAYQTYQDRGRAWSIDTTEPFTHVLTRGAAGAATDDTLAVANPGAFGNGSVVLTSYMPAQLTSPQDTREEARFLQNLLAQRFNMLFLDYGPPIPPGVSVGSDARLVAVPHPNVPGAVVEVKLVLYRFG
ncbi:MAG: hypothetical protein QOE90_3 [Thermoplasmata archaeon]|nr:hypothetical protein [Thermoplasmata archaeon]